MDPGTAKSQSGWIMFQAACPVIWASKLQSQVVRSTTKAEYIAMSMALCDVIPLMELIKEIRERNFNIINAQLYVYCKVFEDNSWAFELARIQDSAHVPSISTYAIIISGKTFEKA